jgi:hypothetical protein
MKRGTVARDQRTASPSLLFWRGTKVDSTNVATLVPIAENAGFPLKNAEGGKSWRDEL